MRFQFPQFFRGKPARLFFSLEIGILWLALGALIAINVWSIQKSRPAYWDKLVMVLWKQGHRQEARNVLGAMTDLVESLARREEEAAELQKKYAFWQSVAASRPDYRDAFISLAKLAYQLGKPDDARTWLARAQTLDPTSPIVQQLSDYFRQDEP